MASTKLQAHPSLPAPTILSVPQSKSHVLAGVQDAYWSDEEEDQECPLCLEEMDISDLNFKPCVCGYQICRFCWHHIKENLNKRCPACRRTYTDEGIEFKPVATQDHKRLTQQKKQRDREKKELETLGRRHLANVRVVQRNVVYVVGINPRFAKEELIPTLRSNEYFGQYGKISKILVVNKRNGPGGSGPVVGLYITYIRREDAARAIAAVDGAPSPGGGQVMRASYGTTKYCMAFLRNVTCNDHNCMNLHEWGDEKDCFTKEDLTTLKHTMKATETRAKAIIVTKKDGEDATLPRAASWGQKSNIPTPPAISHAVLATSSLVRQTRRNPTTRQPRSTTSSGAAAAAVELKSTHMRTAGDRKPPAPASSQNNTSRPSTPSLAAATMRPAAPDSPAAVEKKLNQPKKEPASLLREANSPAPSLATASDAGSAPQEVTVSSVPSRPASVESAPSPASIPPRNVLQAPAIPPGLSAPPGIASPSRPPRNATESPQTPLLASQSSYQISTNARTLLEEITTRRDPIAVVSPFPEFDRTLQTLSGDGGGGFSFNLDPKLADEAETTDILPELEMETNTPFKGSYVDAFPGLRPSSQLPAPPGLSYPRSAARSIFDPVPHRGLGTSPAPAEKLSNYMGSFNPFSDTSDRSIPLSPNTPSSLLPIDEDRKVSRFGFARGRQASSLASSPLNGTSQIGLAEGNGLHGLADDHLPLRWDTQPHDYNSSQPPSMISSPLISAQLPYTPQPRFQPFDSDLSEAQLREFIQVSRDREFSNNVSDGHGGYKPSQHFSDPAIMSASFGPPSRDMGFNSMAYGPPPGLGMLPSGSQALNPHPSGMPALPDSNANVTPSTSSPALSLSVVDFPALVPAIPKDDQSPAKPSASLLPNKSHEKSNRKTAKKATGTDHSGDKLKQVSEKSGPYKLKPTQGRAEKEMGKEPPLSGPSNVSAPVSPVLEASGNKDVAKPQVIPTKSKAESKMFRVDVGEAHREEKPARKEEKLALKEKPSTTKPPKRNDNASNDNASITPSTPKQSNRPSKPQVIPPTPILEPRPEIQVPILSKKPKKSKPVPKVPKTAKEDEHNHDANRAVQATDHSAAAQSSSKLRSASESPDRRGRLSVEQLLEQINRLHPRMDLINHPFFDLQRLSSTAKMPLEYGPLVHALSALSVGGGSFANNVPSGSIDTAVSSFQQLLETLTQTISDLLRLLPRTTWDDSSSFDGVLRDMLKGDDFLDEGGEDGQGRDDEVAALTLALERRARWMEVQLSKLEELHRDINTAAVKAVLTFNDDGWDKQGFLPRLGNSLKRFENIGFTQGDNGDLRPMTADELEKKLTVAKEVAIFAEAEAREAMSKLQVVKQFDGDLY